MPSMKPPGQPPTWKSFLQSVIMWDSPCVAAMFSFRSFWSGFPTVPLLCMALRGGTRRWERCPHPELPPPAPTPTPRRTAGQGERRPHLGEVLSFLDTLRWKREGARHTARLPAVIWFSSAEAMSLRK